MIESERLFFAKPAMEHQPLMFVALKRSRNELKEFLPWAAHEQTEQESVENCEQAIENFNNFEKELRFTILSKETNEFVGVIGLIIRDKSIPFFEIGYWLDSEETGKGYVTEAVKRIEQYAFEELNAKRLEIKVAVDNLKSIAVAERCGYPFEGKLVNNRILPNGQISSTVIFAKTP